MREITKKAPVQQKSSKISSPLFNKKHPLMQFGKVKSILGGMGGVSKREKTLDELRFENQTFDPNRKDDPNLSRKEGNTVVERTRELYGDRVAEEVKKDLDRAYLGNSAITSKKGIQSVGSVRKYGKEVQEGVGLIIQGLDPKHQSGREAKYITREKLENVVEETAERSGKYQAEVLKRQFKVTETQQDESKPKTSSRIVGLREGLLGWGTKSSGDNKS